MKSNLNIEIYQNVTLYHFITHFKNGSEQAIALLLLQKRNVSVIPKYYPQKSTQVLIPNQLKVDNDFALITRNLLIIIIFALYLASLKSDNFSFFVLFSAIFKASEF